MSKVSSNDKKNDTNFFSKKNPFPFLCVYIPQ